MEATVTFSLIALGFLAYFSWIIAGYFRDIAVMKGHTQERYFWVSFLFPVAGYLLVVALPNVGEESSTKSRNHHDLPPI